MIKGNPLACPCLPPAEDTAPSRGSVATSFAVEVRKSMLEAFTNERWRFESN